MTADFNGGHLVPFVDNILEWVPVVPDDHTSLDRSSSRGFGYLPSLTCGYGSKIEVHESSSAHGPHLWLRIRQPSDLNEMGLCNARGQKYEGEWQDAAAHLPVEVAEALIDQLRAVIDGHYQS